MRGRATVQSPFPQAARCDRCRSRDELMTGRGIIAARVTLLHLFQQQVCDDLLELLILGPKLLRFAGTADGGRAELLSPSIERRLCHAELPADLDRAFALIDLLQRLYDLLG